jgi:hypothetical protein
MGHKFTAFFHKTIKKIEMKHSVFFVVAFDTNKV